jgi:PAS domain S-box-containing protein
MADIDLISDIYLAIDLLSGVPFSGVALGVFTALLTMAVGLELRFRKPIGIRSKNDFLRKAAFFALMMASLFFSSAYLQAPALSGRFISYSLTIIFAICITTWLLLIFYIDRVMYSTVSHPTVFQLHFGVLGTVMLFVLHWSLIFLPSAREVVQVHWGGVLFSFGLAVMIMLYLGRMAFDTATGVRRRVSERFAYVTGFVGVNQLIALSLKGFIESKPGMVFTESWMLPIDWFKYEVLLSVFSLTITLTLMVYAYSMLEHSLVMLRKMNRSLQSQTQSAVALAAERDVQLRLEQDRARQLERANELVQKDHQVSIEGLVAALSSLQDGMFEWDLEQDMVDFSPQWRRLLGFVDQMTGLIPAPRWREGILSEDQVKLNKAMQVCLTTPGSSHETQVRYKSQYGNLLKLEIRVVAVKNAYGLPSKLVGILHDRTGEMDLEMSIRAELNEEALLSSRKSQFVDYLAHEIRTPMTVIGSAKALIESCLRRDKVDQEVVMCYVDQIGLALKSLRALVDETLIFMGSGFSHHHLKVVELNVVQMLDGLVKLQSKVREPGRQFDVSLPIDLNEAAFYSDDAALSQTARQLVAFAQNKGSGVDKVVLQRADKDSLSIMMHLSVWPDWMQRCGQLEPTPQGESMIVPFMDEHLPFPLLLTKRVIRFIAGRLTIVSRSDGNWVCVDLPSLKEETCRA